MSTPPRPTTNATHDPSLRSWVASANQPGQDFPLQNLPHGVFRPRGTAGRWRGGVAIGDQVLDLAAAQAAGIFGGPADEAAALAGRPTLNALMALGPAAWHGLRLALSRALREGSADEPSLRSCLLPQSAVDMGLPVAVGEYTDFFTSAHHALNAGRIFQPDRALLPHFKWLPLGYHGRASSVAVSGTPCRRPNGLFMSPGATAPRFGPTRQLDFELELGAFVGPGNRHGEALSVADAQDRLFGVCLLNDWSARDVQALEAQPLGPFLAKNFLSSVSPWVVTMEALAPFQVPLPREAGDPPTPAHLDSPGLATLDIRLEAWLQPGAGASQRMASTNLCHAYWSLAQMLAHHTEGGCPLRPGDLLGTGTLSGPTDDARACLLEITQGGRVPLPLEGGGERRYLEDGDEVRFTGWCERPGFVRIGLGECTGRVVAG